MRKTALLVIIGAFLLGAYCPPLSPPAFCSWTPVQNEESPDRAPSGTYEDVEKKIKELIEELEKLQKDAGQKLRKDVIPRLEKELDKLKEWLRDFRLNEKEQPRTRET